MAITEKDFAASQPGVAALIEANEKAKLAKYLQAQEPEIAGQTQAAKNKANLATFLDPTLRDEVLKGGQVGVGDIHAGADPYAKLSGQGPRQAGAFLKTAQGAYKGINDQLDASKATLDALNQGNSTSDKLALINEARLAAGSGGSRALSHMVSLLAGDPTMAGDLQKGINWLNTTPNIPTLPPAQRDAIRESVFNRLPQLEQMHSQTGQQLMQQGPIVAPQTDTGTLIQSFSAPAAQRLAGLKKMQADYSTQRGQMQGQGNSPVSNPSTADANQTTLQKLGALLKPKFKVKQAPTSPSLSAGGAFGGAPQTPQQVPPDHEAAAAWAKDPKNANDPMAKQILQTQQQMGIQ